MKEVLEKFNEFFTYEKGVYKFVNPFNNEKKPLLYLDYKYISVAYYYLEINTDITYKEIFIFDNWKTLVLFYKNRRLQKNIMLVVLGDVYEEEKINNLKKRISIYKTKITIVINNEFLSNITLLRLVNTLVLDNKYKIIIEEEYFKIKKGEEIRKIVKIEENITLSIIREKLKINIPLKLKKITYEK